NATAAGQERSQSQRHRQGAASQKSRNAGCEQQGPPRLLPPAQAEASVQNSSQGKQGQAREAGSDHTAVATGAAWVEQIVHRGGVSGAANRCVSHRQAQAGTDQQGQEE